MILVGSISVALDLIITAGKFAVATLLLIAVLEAIISFVVLAVVVGCLLLEVPESQSFIIKPVAVEEVLLRNML